MFGLAGFTSTVRSRGLTTRSMSSIGIAPSRTSSPSTSAHDAGSVLELNEHWADVWHADAGTVRKLHFALLQYVEPELEADVPRDAEEHGAGIGEGADLDRCKQGLARVTQSEFGGHDPHASSLRAVIGRLPRAFPPASAGKARP